MKVLRTLVLRSSVADPSSMGSESGSWTTYSLSFSLLNKINSSPPEMEAAFPFVSSLILLSTVGLGSLWLAGFSSTRIVCLAWAYQAPTSWSQLLFYLLCSFLPEMSTASFWTRNKVQGLLVNVAGKTKTQQPQGQHQWQGSCSHGQATNLFRAEEFKV